MGEDFDSNADVAAVSKQALARLHLHPESLAPTTKGADTIRRMLSSLQQTAAGLSELRNLGYGTGHGRGRRVAGLKRRHAEFTARAAVTYVTFVLDTLDDTDAAWRRDDLG